MLHEMAFRLYKCSCGPCENMAFTTKHLLRSLPKFLFSGLCYGGSLNNNLFIRIHKDLLVFTVWPDTKRMEMEKTDSVSFGFSVRCGAGTVNSCYFPLYQIWPMTLPNGMKEADRGVQVALFEPVWQIQGAFLFFHSFLWVRKGKPCLGL